MNDKADSRNGSRRARLAARWQRYSNLLARKWWVPAIGTALGLAVAMAWARFVPARFVSTGRMIVDAKTIAPGGSAEDVNNFLSTQVGMLQSSTVIDRAHARASGGKEEATLPVTLKVAVQPRTTIIVLRGSGRDARYTQHFVQACMDEYIKARTEGRAQSGPTLANLADDAGKLEKELHAADDTVTQFENSNIMALVPGREKSTAEHLASINDRLAAMKSEYDLMGKMTPDQTLAWLQTGSGAAATNATGAAATNSATSNSAYFKAQQQLLALRADRDDLGRYLRPKHPKMIALNDEIAKQERLVGAYREQSAEQLAGKRDALGMEMRSLESERNQLEARTQEADRQSAEYQQLKANAARIQGQYDRLLATVQTMDLKKQSEAENIAIMEPACAGFADGPALWQRLILGGLVGLWAGLLGLVGVDRLDDRMTSYAELEQTFDERVLAQIPKEEPRTPGGEISPIQPQDSRRGLAEALWNLRSWLLYVTEDGRPPKTILVSSSIPGEGRSIIATNLSISLAHAGSRVLLVDADLRKGCLHNYFGTPSQPGLSEALGQGQKWQESVWATKTENLFLLPRGQTTQQAGELFADAAVDGLFGEAAEQYDFVIVDTPPITVTDDAASLAGRVDRVLFVVRAEYTRARAARAGLALLYQRQARLLGLVLNAVRPGPGDYHFYKQRDYLNFQASEDEGAKVKV